MPDRSTSADDRLRDLAHQSLHHHGSAVDLAGDWSALQARLADVPVAAPARPTRPNRARGLAAAAAFVLVVAGIVAIALTRHGDEAPAVSPPPATTTEARTTPATVASTTPATTVADTTPGSTVVPVDVTMPETLASAEPATARPGDFITITPAGVIERACGDVVTVIGSIMEFPLVGLIVDGELSIHPEGGIVYPLCLGATSADPVTFVVPAGMGSGTGHYAMCLTPALGDGPDPNGCADVTVERPPETLPPNVPATGDCAAVPSAPPALIDGSAPGAAVITPGGDGVSRLATWGEPGSPAAVTQILDVAHDSAWADAEWGVARSEGYRAAASVDFLNGQSIVHVVTLEETAGCVRSYLVDPSIQSYDASLLAAWWADALGTGSPVPTGGTDLLASTGYFATHYTNDGVATTREFGPDGSIVREVPADEVSAAREQRLRLPDGRVLQLPDPTGDGRCHGRDLIVTATGEPLHPQLTGLDSAGVSETGVVFATLDVCPTGHWGDPGSESVLVRYDPTTDADPVVIDRIAPDPDMLWYDSGDGVVYSGDGRPVATVSPDGRYLGVIDRYRLEGARWEVRAVSDPASPFPLASACESPRAIASPPEFVSDDVVVVARLCGDAEILHVEAVSLTDNQVVWSNALDWLTADSYSSTAGVSARMGADGEIVAIVIGGGGVEEPSRAAVFTGDAAAEITRLGYRGYAFELADI